MAINPVPSAVADDDQIDATPVADASIIRLDASLDPVSAEGVLDQQERKDFGAHYTDPAVAHFLVRWAVTSSHDIVLDPSFGDGVFLRYAVQQIEELGGTPNTQVYGVELHGGAHLSVAGAPGLVQSMARLIHSDFFELTPDRLPPADAVVGNPPFIRYRRFTGDVRRKALQRAREAGVEISRLTSSWAPFLVHAAEFLRPGGRLAMVAPAELAQASYARPVLDYFRGHFRTTHILTFSRKLFSRLSEDTVLILASGRDEPFESFRLSDLAGPESLEAWSSRSGELPEGMSVDAYALGRGSERLLHYLLPPEGRDLYRRVAELPHVVKLGKLAIVGIGYVSGDNDFFHLDRNTIEAYGIPGHLLRPAARSGSDFGGLHFSRDDWQALHDSGHANTLLQIRRGLTVPESVQAYLHQGARRGVPGRYKCRVRKPWYVVPHVYEADGFLTYMSRDAPKLVSNEAGAVAPNTLHVVRLNPTVRTGGMARLAAAWLTSLSALSCELQGHSLGGGMLKLEPTEARQVSIALPDLDPGEYAGLAHDLDSLLRSDRAEDARDHADSVLLSRGLGLSDSDIQHLRETWLTLKARRLNR